MVGDVPIKEYFEKQFQMLRDDIAELKGVMRRVNELEFAVRIMKWVGGVVTALVIGVALAEIKVLLGL